MDLTSGNEQPRTSIPRASLVTFNFPKRVFLSPSLRSGTRKRPLGVVAARIKRGGGPNGREKEGKKRKQQQQHGAVARALLFPRFFIPPPPPPSFSSVLWYRGFIVFELDAPLFCFVSRAIRGANCRSYAIAFCFLLLPPFLRGSPHPTTHFPLSLSLSLSLSSSLLTRRRLFPPRVLLFATAKES